MKNDHVSIANTTPVRAGAPRKLHKPLRDSGDLTPDQVVTYSDECDVGLGTELAPIE